MVELPGRATPVLIGPAVRLTAPGWTGAARSRPVDSWSVRGGPAAAPPGDALAEAVARNGLTPLRVLELRVTPVPGAGGPLAVAVPRTGQDQVLLLASPDGVLTWHYPQWTPGVGGPGGAVRFVLPERLVAERPGRPATRVLAVFGYTMVEPLIGAGARAIAAYHEARLRPYAVRRYLPGGGFDPVELDPRAWRQLARRGRVLLLVPGAFSRCASGFAGLPAETLDRLAARYGGRVVGFDHPALSVTPAQNVAELLSRLPGDVRLEVDVLCHSRGGLVARALAGDGGRDPAGRVTVRRVVFAGTPNAGTALAGPDHLADLVDRHTTLLTLLPSGPRSAVTDILELVVAVVKIIGHGATGGLPGLRVMNAAGDLIRTLNANRAPAVRRFAVDSDFVPSGGLRRLVRLADATLDRIFGATPNDLIVPAAESPGALAAIGVPAADRLHLDAGRRVWHHGYFSHPPVWEALGEWLPG